MRNDSMNKAGSFRHYEDHVQDLPDLVWISFDLLLHAPELHVRSDESCVGHCRSF